MKDLGSNLLVMRLIFKCYLLTIVYLLDHLQIDINYLSWENEY
jgi:hypothetical protein